MDLDMTIPAFLFRRVLNPLYLPIIAGTFLISFLSASADDERKKPRSKRSSRDEIVEVQKELRETRMQLERTRDSLHEAHRELGFKAESISKLENQVKSMEKQLQTAVVEIRKLSQNSAKTDQLAKSLEKEKHTNELLRKQLEAVKKASAKALAEARSKGAPDKAREAPAKNAEKGEPKEKENSGGGGKSVTLNPVVYEKLSAVSYEGRDRVLEEFRVILKSSPAAVFYLSGHADDSQWDETNRDISINRAQYLANHLQYNGIPEDRIKVKGMGAKKPSKAGNRRVDIVVKVP